MLPDRIRTERLLLRQPAETDIPALVDGVGNLNVSRMLTRVPYPYGAADARRWLATVAPATGRPLLIDLDGAAIGCVSIDGLDATPRLGYWLAEPQWGRGFATEAARALVGAYFAATGAALLRSSVFADNLASWRVQEKLGFIQCGRDTVHCLARGGEVAHIHTALARAEFEKFDR